MTIVEGSYILGIAEKPQAARRIANAIDEHHKPTRRREKNVPLYICTRDSKTFVIAPAIGHLFTLSALSKTWNYPVLDYEWVPSYVVDKTARTKNFVDIFKQLAKGASDIIIMTDFDREGEVIGYLILKYLLGKNTAERMKFSTLTRTDIERAYDKREKSLDMGFLNSGLVRHYIDWLYGINYSRALSLSLQRVSGRFKTISIGRVQGPTLGFIVSTENDIDLFLPVPYWTIESEVELGDKKFEAYYERSKINTIKESKQILKECASKVGKVTNLLDVETYLYPFPPFNLGDLQREAYKHFRFSPNKTLEIAEKLYLQALISYPRTDSQKLPMTLGHKTILTKLKKQSNYSLHAEEILAAKKYKPKEGRRTDAAHPAIHPTGNKPSTKFTSEEKKLYDLIVKRYLSLFGKRAVISKKKIEITLNGHKFEVRGSTVIKKGWLEYYVPYYSPQDYVIPDVELNSKVDFLMIESLEHFSSPPRRFNESSLLKKMEDEKIGTKATRAGIIQTLFNRGYVEGSIIKPTPLGKTVVTVLQDHYPILIQAKMTRDLEMTMEKVEKEKKDISKIMIPIKEELKNNLVQFNNKEREIGVSLHKNLQLTEKTETIIIGKCQVCKKGDLRIIKSRKTGKKFIACSAYFDKSIKCEATYPIPASGTIVPTEEKCNHDGLPLIEWKRGRKRQLMCISPDCPSKQKENKK